MPSQCLGRSRAKLAASKVTSAIVLQAPDRRHAVIRGAREDDAIGTPLELPFLWARTLFRLALVYFGCTRNGDALS